MQPKDRAPATDDGHPTTVPVALFLTEADVLDLFPMERALERVEASFLAQQSGDAVNRARQRIFLPGVSLHYMAAAIPGENGLGMKVYTVSPAGLRFVMLLFEASSGELRAVLEADHLGRIRTGAASGVATKYLARPDASRVGLIGTGRQARTQLEAVWRVRKLVAARVFGRDAERRNAFCREMSERLNLEVLPAESPEAAVRFGDMVIAATSAAEPVVRGAWLNPGTHVNAIGSNVSTRRELDDATLGRAAVIAVDSIEQAKEEAGDLILGLANHPRGWEGVVELRQVVGGSHPGRRSDQDVTVFKSCGIALWDVAAAGYVYRQALEKGRGQELPLRQTPD